jgi:ribosome biogenesis protein BRX1
MQDLMKLLPHSKKDAKVDLKDGVGAVNDIADMEVPSPRWLLFSESRSLQNCDLSMLLEVRRREDLYVWMSKSPQGPSIKFQCNNG